MQLWYKYKHSVKEIDFYDNTEILLRVILNTYNCIPNL